jgi:hypothetical protein
VTAYDKNGVKNGSFSMAKIIKSHKECCTHIISIVNCYYNLYTPTLVLSKLHQRFYCFAQ